MGVQVSRLSNGMTIATENIPHLESVALGIWVKSGSRNESDDEHGIAHLLEHMAFKGTGRRSAWEIASQIENVGGEINAATGAATTAFPCGPCTLTVDPSTAVVLSGSTNARGRAWRNVPLPGLPGLVGANLFAQWLLVAPGGCAGLAFSNGLQIGIQ